MVEFICETTVNHLGNFHILAKMALLADKMGCDWIRVPRKDVYNFYSKEKLASEQHTQLPYGRQYGQWRDMFEFTLAEFQMFDIICRRMKLPWFSTIMDWPSLEFFQQYFHLPAFKIASCNARNEPFLKKLAESVPTNKLIVASVGGSTLQEIEKLIKIFPEHDMYLFHCIAEYPTAPENLRLGNITELVNRFESDRITIGYSGHDITIGPSVVAVKMGAQVVEQHFTLQRHDLFPRANVGLEPPEFAKLIKVIREDNTFDKYVNELPDKAFQTKFGMSKLEEPFLKSQEYKV